jgi:hypothetical protein
MRETHTHALPRSKLILIADQESDFCELLSEAKEEREHFLIRARVNRELVPEESECCESIQEALAARAPLGQKTLSIPGNGKRKAREATLEVRVAKVTIKPPQGRGEAKACASIEPTTMRVIAATEIEPPEGQEAVSSVLLTDLRVADFARACEKIEWCGKR